MVGGSNGAPGWDSRSPAVRVGQEGRSGYNDSPSARLPLSSPGYATSTSVSGGYDMWDTSSSSGRGPGRFNNTLYGIFIGALVVVLIWMFSVALRGSGDPSTGGSVASDSGPQAELANADSAAPTAMGSPRSTGGTQDKEALRAAVLSDCRTAYKAQTPPLRAAAAAMAQWQVHIGAMNQLVLGVISLQQATQFWNQTRVGAQAHLHAFQLAVEPLKLPSALCPAPPRSAASNGKLVRCEQAVAARLDVLRVSQVALGTWRMHVMHMEMLREGKMTPQQAEAAWLQSWHQGQQEVTRYRAAVRAASGPRC
jgi:hypothetical protein